MLRLELACHRLSALGAHLQARRPRDKQQLSAAACTAVMSEPGGQISSRAALDRLEKVLNARDLAEACPKVIPGRLYRSGNPAAASLSDVALLRGDLGITHMLDFRSAEEQSEDRGWPLVLSNGVIRTYDARGKLAEVAVEGAEEVALAGLHLPRCELHRLSLLEKDRFVWGLVMRLPVFSVFKALAYRLLGWHDAMRDVLVPEINRGGLAWVYEILMESGTAEIRRSLELTLAAARAACPQLIFCKLGKDRTGVMAALLLTCCAASEDEIVADYVRSDGIHAVALGGLEKMRDMQGMDAALFSSAPTEAMRALLCYARRRWGGLEGYMVSIGFGAEQQHALGAALTEGPAWGRAGGIEAGRRP